MDKCRDFAYVESRKARKFEVILSVWDDLSAFFEWMMMRMLDWNSDTTKCHIYANLSVWD